jgi:hypothetical protein
MRYEFIESGLFTKMVYDYLSEADYIAFQQFLLGKRNADFSSNLPTCAGAETLPLLVQLMGAHCAATVTPNVVVKTWSFE